MSQSLPSRAPKRKGRYLVYIGELPPGFHPYGPADVPEVLQAVRIERRGLTLSQAVDASRLTNRTILQATPDPELWSMIVIGPKPVKGGVA